MARLYKRADSPYWYLEYRNAEGVQRESTGLRQGTREGQRTATGMLNQKLAEEKALSDLPMQSAFANWVMPFIRQHCVNSLSTFHNYRHRWDVISMFLRSRKLRFPVEITYGLAFEYLEWRVTGGGGAKVTQNTAKDDLDTFRLIMSEAVRRGFCTGNPLLRLRIKSVSRRERPEITEKDLARIRYELRHGKWPLWMLIHFEIGMHTARRISEARTAMKTMNLERGEYTVRVKGGSTKTKPIHPELLKLLRAKEGKYEKEISRGRATWTWRKFFNSLGMKDYTFHCLRSTFIARGRRAGIDRWTLMQIADHATVAINVHYDRFGDSDLRSALSKMKFPRPQKGA